MKDIIFFKSGASGCLVINGVELLSIEAASFYLPWHPSASTLWRWRKCGRVGSFRFGGRVYVMKADLDELLAFLSSNVRAIRLKTRKGGRK